MQRQWRWVMWMGCLVLGVAAAGGAFAQQGGMGGMMGRGWGPSGHYARMYDPKTVETVAGTVAKVEKFTPMRGMSTGIHLEVTTANGPVAVHLGPSWFLDRQAVKVGVNDKVEITGSRITFDGKPAIIAAEVRKGDAVLKLRDAQGVPLWGGGMRRQRQG